MELPGPEHVIFIPGVLLIGIVIGYVMGQRTMRAEMEKKRKRAQQ